MTGDGLVDFDDFFIFADSFGSIIPDVILPIQHLQEDDSSNFDVAVLLSELGISYTAISAQTLPRHMTLRGTTLAWLPQNGAVGHHEVRLNLISQVDTLVAVIPYEVENTSNEFIYAGLYEIPPTNTAVGNQIRHPFYTRDSHHEYISLDNRHDLKSAYFTLIDAPLDAQIDSWAGLFLWTPSEPGTYNFIVQSDDLNGEISQFGLSPKTCTIWNDRNRALF